MRSGKNDEETKTEARILDMPIAHRRRGPADFSELPGADMDGTVVLVLVVAYIAMTWMLMLRYG
jgi:hypothetical protein